MAEEDKFGEAAEGGNEENAGQRQLCAACRQAQSLLPVTHMPLASPA